MTPSRLPVALVKEKECWGWVACIWRYTHDTWPASEDTVPYALRLPRLAHVENAQKHILRSAPRQKYTHAHVPIHLNARIVARRTYPFRPTSGVRWRWRCVTSIRRRGRHSSVTRQGRIVGRSASCAWREGTCPWLAHAHMDAAACGCARATVARLRTEVTRHRASTCTGVECQLTVGCRSYAVRL